MNECFFNYRHFYECDFFYEYKQIVFIKIQCMKLNEGHIKNVLEICVCVKNYENYYLKKNQLHH